MFLIAKFSQAAGDHEEDATIEDGFPDLHRQVDTQDSVFAKTENLSARAVASPYRKLAADAN
jgi:hypothetical protein